MSDAQQTPPQEQPQVISKAGLSALYTELGEARHTIHELNARLAAFNEQHQAFVTELRAHQATHGNGKCAPILDGEVVPPEPIPIVQGSGRSARNGAG